MIARADLQIEPATLHSVDLRALAAFEPDLFPALFDSAAHGNLGQYSILAALPTGVIQRDFQGRVCASGAAPTHNPQSGFLDALQSWWQSERSGTAMPEQLPFAGGWIVFLSYEMAAEIEPSLQLPAAASGAGAPTAIAMRVGAAVVLHHDTGRSWLVAESAALMTRLRAAIATTLAQDTTLRSSDGALFLQTTEDPPQRYLQQVRSALEYIAAGDIYQANLSRAWRAEVDWPDMAERRRGLHALYQRLCTANPAPFAAFVQFGDWALLSSSPERLVAVRDGRVETRPIAGTRARAGAHQNAASMAQEKQQLLHTPKERAEHIMLIDLERNDLGRVCQAGSVHVQDFMVIETYRHVHHIVSGVVGQLRPDCRPTDVLRAVFPGGTITGCPKVRCMQIIAELEAEPRGAYTGSVGYLNHDGSMDFNIVIRSIVVHGQALELRAGAGIVADSDPERELAETRIKAEGVLRSLRAPGAPATPAA